MTAWWGDDGLLTAPVAEAMRRGASQDAWELEQALGLIALLAPRTLVEIGCDRGGALYAWRSVAEVVIGITLADNSYETGGSGLALDPPPGSRLIVGDSHAPATRALLLDALVCAENPTVAHAVDVLVIDGDHTEAGVLADLVMYGALVRPDGLILLHDITSTNDPRAEVHKLWPHLAPRFETAEIRNPDGGFGWGVIHVRDGDRFEEADGG